jgi:hypothetical protein
MRRLAACPIAHHPAKASCRPPVFDRQRRRQDPARRPQRYFSPLSFWKDTLPRLPLIGVLLKEPWSNSLPSNSAQPRLADRGEYLVPLLLHNGSRWGLLRLQSLIDHLLSSSKRPHTIARHRISNDCSYACITPSIMSSRLEACRSLPLRSQCEAPETFEGPCHCPFRPCAACDGGLPCA